MNRNEVRAEGTAGVRRVINVVLTRVHPRAHRSQFNRRNEGQLKVCVESNMIPRVTCLEFSSMV